MALRLSRGSARPVGPVFFSLALAAAAFALESSATAQTDAPGTPAPATAAPAAPAAPATPATPPAKADPSKDGKDKKDKGKKDKAAEPAATEPAPAPAAASATAAEAHKDEEKAKKDDEQKEDKQAVYLSADLGFTRPDVGGFSDTTGLDRTAANGLLAGLGVGYRNHAFRFGARFRDASTTEFSLWSIMGEIGYGLRLRPLSPTFFIHAGYMFDTGVERGAFASKLPAGNTLTPDIDLQGAIIGGEIVGSYWLTQFLRVGPFIGFDVTVLHRSQPRAPQSIFAVPDSVRNNDLFGDSGNGLGYVLNIGIRLTGDIGFDHSPEKGEKK